MTARSFAAFPRIRPVEVAAPARARGRWRDALEERRFLAAVLIGPAVLFIAVLVLAPLLLAIYLSLTDATAGSLSGDFVGLRNYTEAWDSPNFRRALRNTVIFTVISQVIVLLVAGVLAHQLAKPFRVVNWLLARPALPDWLEIKPIDPFAPPQWLGHSTLAMAAIIFVHTWRIIPFATVIFLAGLASIPAEVEDAAKVDGATGLKKFWYVTLPLQLPIATVALLFGIVFTATDMTVVYILTHGGPFNSTHMLTTWAFDTGINSAALGQGAAISLYLLPVLILVAVLMLRFARKVEVS